MTELVIVALVYLNVLRVDHTSVILENPNLSQRAELRADYLCNKGQWSHEGWQESFVDLHYRFYGENLAKGFTTEKEAHIGWFNSPSHLENMLNPTYSFFGIGYSEKCNLYVELYAGGFVW